MTKNSRKHFSKNQIGILCRILSIWSLLILNFSYTASRANVVSDLHVVVSGLQSNSGNVHIALYDNPATFPEPGGMILDIEVYIFERTARHSFIALDHKNYAIAVYHDANDNNSFDQGFLGVPLEDYAFSNNAKAFLRPPSFSDAAFNLSETTKIVIKMND